MKTTTTLLTLALAFLYVLRTTAVPEPSSAALLWLGVLTVVLTVALTLALRGRRA